MKYWDVAVVRPLGVVLALSLAAAACDGSNASDSGPTVPTEAPTTSTTTLEQSYAIPADPADITPDYLNRIFAALDKVQGDVHRKINESGKFEQADLVPLRAVFNDPELEIQAEGFARLAGGDKAALRQPPGDNLTTVVRVIRATRDCVYVEATVDVSRTVVSPPPPRTTYLELRPTQVGADPLDINPTPWSLADEDTGEETKCAG